MDVQANPTAAVVLATEKTSAAPADEVPTYDPTTTTQHSLMDELPPLPPSPYRAMKQTKQRTSPGKPSIASTFLRGRRKLQVSPAAVAAAAETLSGTPPPRSTEESDPNNRGGTPMAFDNAPNSLVYQSIQNGDSAMFYTNAETHDSAMQQYLLYEAPRQRLVEREENERNATLAKEEVAFTSAIINALQERAELLAGNEAEELVVSVALERASARREMLRGIEAEVGARLREQRLAEMLELQSHALLPAYEAGYHRIQGEEREDLRRVFLWHKENRPLGPGCYIKAPEEDYRLRYSSRCTSVASTGPGRRSLALRTSRRSTARSQRTSRDYVALLRQRNSSATSARDTLKELVPLPLAESQKARNVPLIQDGTFGPGEEAVFVEEGRLRLQAQKARRHEELRERRRFAELVEAQTEARQYVLAEEALCWMHLTRAAVDGLYAAKEAVRLGKKEATEREAREERLAQRNVLKEKLLRERGLQEGAVIPTDAVKSGEPEAAALGAGAPVLHPRSGSGHECSAVRKSSDSTVPNSSTATDSSVDPQPDTNDDEDVPLAHLRLIAEETDDSKMCRQLTALTSSDAVNQESDEL
ncbi:hypothetical protein ABL78_0017 [Leptomonas seymouri]|uniref:Uncharacterized protein n=1 Tax=Leptomonas seymouri TaxID=5684 RepID=A0A0N1IMW1_LEPSE|nr:hypothetical protein ABL78_0017 [Leptomonas seymouri]|eukprot:KPI90784.1 hypothetical protein ABL78_0017 [Leptomonas seymouri]